MQKEQLESITEEKRQFKPNASELVEQVSIQGTPFTAIKADEKWFLAMERYRVSDFKTSFEETLQLTKEVNWNLLATLCTIMYQELEKDKKEEINNLIKK